MSEDQENKTFRVTTAITYKEGDHVPWVTLSDGDKKSDKPVYIVMKRPKELHIYDQRTIPWVHYILKDDDDE